MYRHRYRIVQGRTRCTRYHWRRLSIYRFCLDHRAAWQRFLTRNILQEGKVILWSSQWALVYWHLPSTGSLRHTSDQHHLLQFGQGMDNSDQQYILYNLWNRTDLQHHCMSLVDSFARQLSLLDRTFLFHKWLELTCRQRDSKFLLDMHHSQSHLFRKGHF